jgi:hypothetical protein
MEYWVYSTGVLGSTALLCVKGLTDIGILSWVQLIARFLLSSVTVEKAKG